jgi:hypothetical protein
MNSTARNSAKLPELLAIGLVLVLASCETPSSNGFGTQEPAGAATSEEVSSDNSAQGATSTADDGEGTPIETSGARPRFSPDGDWLVFESKTPSGEYAMFRMRRDGGGLEQIGPKDRNNRYPTFDVTGERVIYASDTDGDFDLYALDLETGESERVTNMEGDEIEPAVSPIRYTFYAAQTDSCTASGASGTILDAYEKVAFTRSLDGGERVEVWFASMTPTEQTKQAFQTWREPPVSQKHALHTGRLSEADEHCESPRWSGDGLSIVWSCRDGDDPVVMDGPASWEQSFAAAIKAVRGDDDGKSCDEGDLENWRTDECIDDLPRKYSRYEVEQASAAQASIAQPSVSANQVVLLGQKDGTIVWRRRAAVGGEDDQWRELKAEHSDIRYPTWDPYGGRVVFDVRAKGGRVLRQADTDFYLQDVQNLNTFPEVVRTESKRLDENGFVARPGDWKEFYAYYDKLRYMRRPAFVTADAALQAFRDEFQRVLQDAESRAAQRLHLLGGALYRHYWKRYQETKNPTDLYYARYFAAGWAPLEAYERLEKPDEDMRIDARWGLEGERKKEYERLTAPAIERIPETLPEVIEDMPDPVAEKVGGWVNAMIAHKGVGTLEVPSYKKPFKIDFSQFKVRGTYAENDKGAYFLAMNWYGMVPLPFDGSLDTFQKAMRDTSAGKTSAIDLWRRIDSTVGAFMGSPVDPAPNHLIDLADDDPKALSKFDGDAVADTLREMVGPTAIRDANSASPSTTRRKIKVTFMPKRKGLDSEFFSRLTHPTVEMRPLASALDVFAVFGIDAAFEHALASAKGEEYRDEYEKTLEALRKKHGGSTGEAFATTDIYHSWMAVLVTLADQSDIPEDAVVDFARTDAWADRELNSALAGFAQLKHSAVLYAAQDFAAECAGARPTYVLVEQPVRPQPRGFVDPQPAFFAELAALAGGVYEHMNDGKPPASASFGYGTGVLNAKTFAETLAQLSEKQVSGRELTPDEYNWIRVVGGRLETISLNHNPKSQTISGSGDARAERGVALATDIQTNGVRALALQVAIGRLMDMYVAVPNDPGRRMTQGGIYSFYEFTREMSKRLTDAEWNELIESGDVRQRPAWRGSFVQDVDVQWSEEPEGADE